MFKLSKYECNVCQLFVGCGAMFYIFSSAPCLSSTLVHTVAQVEKH